MDQREAVKQASVPELIMRAGKALRHVGRAATAKPGKPPEKMREVLKDVLVPGAMRSGGKYRGGARWKKEWGKFHKNTGPVGKALVFGPAAYMAASGGGEGRGVGQGLGSAAGWLGGSVLSNRMKMIPGLATAVGAEILGGAAGKQLDKAASIHSRMAAAARVAAEAWKKRVVQPYKRYGRSPAAIALPATAGAALGVKETVEHLRSTEVEDAVQHGIARGKGR